MDVRFAWATDGRLVAVLGNGWGLFDEALADAVAPELARDGTGLSTWTIDVVERRARDAAKRLDDGTLDDAHCDLANGNYMCLRFHDGRVIAEHEWDDDERWEESMPLDDFLALLAQWRDRVLAAGGHSRPPLPTHKRVWVVASSSAPELEPRSEDRFFDGPG